MPAIRRLVLDVLQPHDPSILDLTRHVADGDGVAGVNGVIVDVDREVQTAKLTVEGEDIDYQAIESMVEGMGASVHSIDQVVCGERLVEEVSTPQD